jgi:hypothetical protein
MFYITHTSKKDEKWLEKNLKPSFKLERTSVSVWSYYYRDEIGPLVIIKKGGIITATKTVKKYYILFI